MKLSHQSVMYGVFSILTFVLEVISQHPALAFVAFAFANWALLCSVLSDFAKELKS